MINPHGNPLEKVFPCFSYFVFFLYSICINLDSGKWYKVDEKETKWRTMP